jgi:hypothetical protein
LDPADPVWIGVQDARNKAKQMKKAARIVSSLNEIFISIQPPSLSQNFFYTYNSQGLVHVNDEMG